MNAFRIFIYGIFAIGIIAVSHFYSWLSTDEATALLSALALIAFIDSLNKQTEELGLQREDLKLQREEMRLTREEMERARQEMEQQNATLSIQKFENTFFNMVTLHHDIVNQIDIFIRGRDSVFENRIPDQTLKGRDAFQHFYEILMTEIDKIVSPAHPNIKELLVGIRKGYFIAYKRLNSDFGHYFRNLYRLIKTIDEHKFHNDEVEDYKIKYKYTSIVRAQLSDYEIIILAYNCITWLGDEFRPLIEKYTILKSIPDELIKHTVIYNEYCISAQFKPLNNLDLFLKWLKEPEKKLIQQDNQHTLFLPPQ